ncbi:ShlB/FhaC/HecB family hemolysin secretion/activation protein [Rubrivivax sp. A210]|uniref:ShlB/FhaC/HecB family hemolysin secretion/activation protein n=1 Tax=Rubrivivax sp. A210 TaxID=2772301 RepID=UPI0019CC59D3|nr:ShlB/FhaC/HecB family hemolysin secretion/activation protein [Rubrivivax sp. A210]CAD5367386.1 ShlB/FhaC/HecB family hemolysin secretion/activation protein [Rubrivivax sp. A210]
MQTPKLLPVSAALLFTLAHLPAQAQTATPPDAGALRQQIEQGQQPALPAARRPVAPPAPEYKPAGNLSVTVARFEFRGNSLLGDAALQAAVAPWLQRPLDFAELQRAVAAAANAYREAGWIVRAYLPQQEIAAGTVVVQIVEARFGAAQINSAQGLRLDPERARRMVLAAQPTGAPLSGQAVDRALLLIQDLPGVSVKGNLAPGKEDGETDLLVRLDARPLWTGDATLDNVGSRSTGAWRLAGSVQARSAFALGDMASVNLIHSEGSDYLRAAASLPLGFEGLRLGASVSTLDYKVVSADFSALDLKGSSSTLGLDATYPVIRATARNLYASANLDLRGYRNSGSGVVTSDYSVRVLSAGLSGSQFDEWQGGGLTTASLTLSAGQVDLGGSPNEALDAAAAHTQGSFQKLRFSLGRQQTVDARTTLHAVVSGQFASRNLDSGEKIYLGGSTGVRAYPSSEAGGSEGLSLAVDLRFRVNDNLSVGGLYDWGQVTVNRKTGFPGATPNNRLSLQGLGATAAWATPWGVNLSATWSHRLGDNPNATAGGQDQDGTLVKNRLWFSATYTH